VELIDVFRAIAAAGSVACVHAENDEVIQPLISRALADGHTDARMHARTRPPVSETQSVLKALEFAHATGCKLHICHASLPRSIELIHWYADAGLDVSVETCPHYLLFSEDDLALQRGRLKINPPLRGASDAEDLWRQLARGDIDYVASDHAPWPLADKVHDNIFDNHSGVPGVEVLVPLFLDAALRRGLPVELAARLLATNPAQRLGLDGRKGALIEGADADVLVFDRSAEWTVDESTMHSNAGWSPYHGRRLRGRVQLTVNRGEIVWDGEQLVGRAGRGQFIQAGSVVRERGMSGVSA
jgi:allantoinase